MTEGSPTFLLVADDAEQGLGSAGMSGYVINDGAWYHIAGTHDGTTSTIYVNGALDIAAAKGDTFDGDCDCHIGREPWRYSDNDLDEVRISNIGRSAAWVKGTYNAGNRENLLP